MSEYLEAEIHETAQTVEVRWRYGDRAYGIVMAQEMFDVLDITDGQKTPGLLKVSIGLDHPALGTGIIIREGGFECSASPTHE